jgi:hypothetical protein
MVKWTVDLIGIDYVAIGTDLSRKRGQAELDWMRMGRWMRTPDYGAGSPQRPGKVPPPEFMSSTLGFPRLAEAPGRGPQRPRTMPENGVSAGQHRSAEPTGCKTVRSAYVGSNPTPATPCENGPLAGISRLAGRFFSVPRCVAL